MAEARSSKAGMYAELRTARDAISSAAGLYVELSAAQVRSSMAGAYVELRSANVYSSAAGAYVEIMESREGPTRRGMILFNGHRLPVVGFGWEARTREADTTNVDSEGIERLGNISEWKVTARGHWSPDVDDVLGAQVAQSQEANNRLLWIAGHRNREVTYSTLRSFVARYLSQNDLDMVMVYEVSFAISGLVNRQTAEE